MGKFKQRSNPRSGFKMMGSSPNKQMSDLRRSFNDPANFGDERIASTSDYAGMYDAFDFNANKNANVDHLRRDNFERNKRGKLTPQGKRDKKAHEAWLARRSKNPRRSDVEKDRTQSQLLDRDIKRGITQVQDPYGNWHRMNRSGNIIGSRHGLSAESRAWRDKMSLNPNYDPNASNMSTDADGNVVLTHTPGDYSVTDTTDEPTPDPNTGRMPVKNATVTTEPGGGTTVTNTDTGEVVQDNYNPGEDNTQDVVTASTDAQPADSEGTFSDAFRAARERGDKDFEWQGKSFNSRRADETPEEWNEKFGGGDIPEDARLGAQPSQDVEEVDDYVSAPDDMVDDEVTVENEPAETFDEPMETNDGGGDDDDE